MYPYLLYCNLAWGGCASQHLDKLFLIQKKIIRLITKEKYLAHTNPLFYRTGILKVHDINFYLLAIEGFKLNLNSGFNLPSHNYQTRHRLMPIPTSQRLITSQKSLSYSVPRAWNLLPEHVKQSNSMRSFKRLCKSYILSKYM